MDEPVGTNFHVLANRLGIDENAGCDCVSLAGEMNDLGIEGCRRERDRLIQKLRKNAKRVLWPRKLRAGVLAISSGLVFKVNPFDPLPGLFDEAVRITEEQ